jgi:hypothetical protein
MQNPPWGDTFSKLEKLRAPHRGASIGPFVCGRWSVTFHLISWNYGHGHQAELNRNQKGEQGPLGQLGVG